MKAAIFLAMALVVAPLSAMAQQSTQTYAEISPAQYGVELAYQINGTGVVVQAPCTDSAPGSSCLPQLYPGDKVFIRYFVNSTAPVNSTSTITLKGCYGPQSSANRAWRKASPVIVDDKSCSVKVAAALPPTGNFTYTISASLAPAVYRIQALEICTGNVACSYGSSAGFYQTNTIDYTPGWLKAMAGCFAAIGPLSLALFFVWESYVKKRQ